jgi:hypothetical protein
VVTPIAEIKETSLQQGGIRDHVLSDDTTNGVQVQQQTPCAAGTLANGNWFKRQLGDGVRQGNGSTVSNTVATSYVINSHAKPVLLLTPDNVTVTSVVVTEESGASESRRNRDH